MSLQENKNHEDGDDNDNHQASSEDAAAEMIDTPEKRKTIAGAINDIIQLQKDRKAIQDEINENLSKIEAQGVNKKAAKAVIKRMQLTEADRKVQDLSYDYVCTVMGVGLQSDLFKETPTTH